MPRNEARMVRANELSPALRRRLGLVPDDEVRIVVSKVGKSTRRTKDAWVDIRGTLSAEEADQMIKTIHESRRNKTKQPQF